MSQRSANLCTQRWQVPGRTSQVGAPFRTPDGVVDQCNAKAFGNLPESGPLQRACDTKLYTGSQTQPGAHSSMPLDAM
jgi:hypothetical protein